MLPVKLFISYAHDDREKWLALIVKHLRSAQTLGLIDIFEDGAIKPGEAWSPRIQRELEAASIVVLIVTPALCASIYCIKVELERSLQRRVQVIPILTEHCNWRGMPFAGLEPVPAGSNKRPKPLSTWRDKDEPLALIAEKIEALAREIGARKAAAASSIVTPGRLPDLVWNFTGRTDELDTLRRQLTSSGRAAITPHAITGLGGIGKTQLALAYADRHRGDYDLVHWLPAEESAGLAAAYVALAPALGLDPETSDQGALIAVIRERLESRDRSLLIFDNAPGPAELRPYLPKGKGHVLITSRERNWRGSAQPLELDLLPEEDAVELLTGGSLDAVVRAEAKALAEELGFLPLALAQAQAYIDELAVDIPTYRRRLAASAKTVLARGLLEGADYPHSVASVWQTSVEAAERRCPAARPLLELLAFLAPDAVPRNLFDAGPELLPKGLREPAERDEAVGALARFSLIRADPVTLAVHRLVQAVTREQLDDPARTARVETVVRLVTARLPSPAWEHENRLVVGALLPHALASVTAAEQFGIIPETVPTLLKDLAAYHWARAAWQEAEQLAKHGLAIGEEALDHEHQDLAPIAAVLALIYQGTGRYAEAEPLYQRATAIGEKALGPEHPNLATRLNNLALLYRAIGRYAEAEPLLQRAIAIDEKTLGPEHPDLATDLNNLANLYRATGRYAEAEPLYQRATIILERTLPPNHPSLRTVRHNYASLLDQLGRTEEGVALRARADAAGP